MMQTPIYPHTPGNHSLGAHSGPLAKKTRTLDCGFEEYPSDALRQRELLYRLMISQLFYDGYQQIAVQLANVVNSEPACPPSDRLFHISILGLLRESEKRSHNSTGTKLYGTGLDLEYETDVVAEATEPALYKTVYVTSHKGFCRAGAINPDGTLCATGSSDASIKILDVSRMLAKSNNESIGSGGNSDSSNLAGHPVIRTLYDHTEEVTCLEFHPRVTLLASGSRDCTVKLFDYSKSSAKKSNRTISDAEHVTSMSFHPTGDFLLVGCDSPVVRMYDVNTSQCFVGAVSKEQHEADVSSVKWSNNGKLYVSTSVDGSVKIWDGISSRCVSTFVKAHDGSEVCSAVFTRNGKYVLTSGKDSLIKLWEISTTRCLIAYTGAGATGRQEHRAQAVFNHTEDFVMFPDEATTSLCCWNSRNASRQQLLSLGHNLPIRYLVHSPTSSAFLTCSDDFRARFWFYNQMGAYGSMTSDDQVHV